MASVCCQGKRGEGGSWGISSLIKKSGINLNESYKYSDRRILHDSRSEYTILSWAADNDHPEIVKSLLEAGADSTIHSPLCLAAFRGHTNVVKELLEAGVNPNIPDHNGQAPLLLAVAGPFAKVEIVNLLLSHANMVDITNDTLGSATLALAAARGQFEIIKVLL